MSSEPGRSGESGDVRPAAPDDLNALSRMLARAFADDPVAHHLLPSARRRPAGLRAYMGIQVRELLPAGGVMTNAARTGAAVWAPPGKPLPTGLRAVLSVLPVIPSVAGRGLPRALRFLAGMERVHASEPHWYLAVLGTDPDHQGRGVGGRLITPVLERCDEEGVPARLESSNPRNVPFYLRHRFEVVEEVRFGHGAPPLTLMRREPRPPPL